MWSVCLSRLAWHSPGTLRKAPSLRPLPPHMAQTPTTSEDQKTVAALDTQYQAAVKTNDAATMDRILADDFVLSTGSGKKIDETGSAFGGAQRSSPVPTPGRYRANGSRMGRRRGGNRQAMGERHRLRQALRLYGVVQRYICANFQRLDLCFRTIFPAVTQAFAVRGELQLGGAFLQQPFHGLAHVANLQGIPAEALDFFLRRAQVRLVPFNE